ncbi:maltoporin [Vibrio xiamenensis]|uniref:Maltoporin n=1 Tax=Vibrio xiamenensis TaxID=861298 RepID=A0A1G8GDQ2_9VIBR|nr:carbohydrate porin [Vibrio xiamenensis]SDH92470.1 maltoporin [Vibrio xiamenensis]
MLLKKKQLFKYISLALVLCSGSVYALEFHGYARGGVFTSTNGEMKSYRLNNLGRFGNEVDGYYDMAFQDQIFSDDSGRRFDIRVDAEGNMDLRNNWESVGDDTSSDDDSLSSTNNPLAVTQFFVEGYGYIPSLPDASIWVGKRSYKSRELQMFDYKLIGVFGPGAGIDHIKVGPGNLSLAWIRNDSTADVKVSDADASNTLNNNNILDFRYADIPLFNDVKGEVLVNYSLINDTEAQKYNEANGTNYKAENSLQSSFIMTVPLDKGFNETVIQYGDGGQASNMVNHGYYLQANSDFADAKGYRIVNYGEEYLTDNIIANHAIAYAYADELGDGLGYEKAQELSVAFRPEYIWNHYSKSAVELSWFGREETSGSTTDEYSGYKVTVAQVISVGESQFVRPEIRIYSTYLKANDETPFADDKDSQLSFGVQMEAWW